MVKVKSFHLLYIFFSYTTYRLDIQAMICTHARRKTRMTVKVKLFNCKVFKFKHLHPRLIHVEQSRHNDIHPCRAVCTHAKWNIRLAMNVKIFEL